MLSGCGFNFFGDFNCLDNPPIIANTMNDVRLQNGIFDHWNVTENVENPYSPTIPSEWTLLTIMDANFNGDLGAGNLEYDLTRIEGYKIKRRLVGAPTWVTLGYVDNSLHIGDVVWQDNLAVSGGTYEYAVVPIVDGNETNYITNTIGAEFDGVFICDTNTIYKFYAGVSYGTGEQVQKIGVFEPYGRKYPVVVSNALTNYMKGSFTGTVLPKNFLENGNLNPIDMTEEQKWLLTFLSNRKPKIIKDWANHSWLISIVDSPQIDYQANSGMCIASVSANYVEIGDVHNQQDLYSAGLTKEVQ